jgi:hypothetical protein
MSPWRESAAAAVADFGIPVRDKIPLVAAGRPLTGRRVSVDALGWTHSSSSGVNRRR